jgi:dTMP kinase
MSGLFFSFDGIDGVGKTTQIQLFRDWLRELGYEVVVCRDPGGTQLGEAVREILLHRSETPLGPTSEMLLYMASRAQLVAEIIQPALSLGHIVISDRFLLANVAYQGHAGGLDVEQVWSVGQVATAGITPNRTYLLDMPVATAAARLQRTLDRMESRGDEFLSRVRDGFLVEAKRLPNVRVLNAAQDAAVIQDEIRRDAKQLLNNLAD